ncbi:hypothetical protein [Nioella aestuarii]|uniref:hypothetical protein n=1 Tax=Nioella aestuarii TaxID=1662864 RepID=UPI003D7F992D
MTVVDGNFRFVADPKYYMARFDDAKVRCQQLAERAAFPINGSEARVRKALKIEKALYLYCQRKADLLRLGAYRHLPSILSGASGRELVYRQLIVGPFEGRFLVRERERVMLGSLFLWHEGEIIRGI